MLNLEKTEGKLYFKINIYKLDEFGKWKNINKVRRLSDGFWDNGELRQTGKTTLLLEEALNCVREKQQVTFINGTNRGAELFMQKFIDLGVRVNEIKSKDQNKISFINGGSFVVEDKFFIKNHVGGVFGIVIFDNSAYNEEGYFVKKYMHGWK